MKIDAHHHLWDLDIRPQEWTAPFPELARSFGLDDLRPELRANHVDGTVLVQTVDIAEETPELLDLALNHPEIIGVIGWVDLESPDVADRLAELRSLRGGNYLVGVRHQVQSEVDPDFLARPGFRRGLAVVAELGLAYDMLVRPWQLPMVVDAVRAVPQLRVILDHCGKPALQHDLSHHWIADITRLAQHRSVAVKLSGLVSEADPNNWTNERLLPAASVVLDRFGPERVMVGSDWPACLPAATYSQVWDTAESLIDQLCPSGREQLIGMTAAKWYRLDV